MTQTITGMFQSAVDRHAERAGYMYQEGDSWKSLTYREAAQRVRQIGGGLVDLGLEQGDRVAILANSRLEWSLSDYAILGAGCIVVPIYQTSSPAECQYILNDCGARAIVVEDAEQLAKIKEVRDQLPQLEHVVLMDGASAGDVVTLSELERRGEQSTGQWDERGSAIRPEHMATYIYTSGTTGPPKGCMISHGNYASMTEMVAGVDELILDDDRIVLFLPLAHTFARLVHFLTPHLGVQLCYSTVPTLMDDLAHIRPTVMPSVPRVFEKAHAKISGKFEAATGAKKKLVDWALRVGTLRAKYLAHQRHVPPVLAAQYAVAKKLVFSKIHDTFGGELRLCISGGAPLSVDVAEFFLAADIPILEGYGLTESTTALTINRPKQFRLGSVGLPFEGTELRVADDGEILARGPQIFQGYFNNEAATTEVLDSDGWLHTGDVGDIDQHGYLRITDRKKDIIVTAGGKNVSPQNIENALKARPFISQALVYGDRKPYLTALLTLDPIEMSEYAEQNKLPTDMTRLVATDEVTRLCRETVDKVNGELGRVEQIKRFRILPIDFTQETGELTPTLKLKRKVVSARFQQYIDAMYESDAAEAEAITNLEEPSAAKEQPEPAQA